MSVRRQTANRLTLFRTCGTCGKQIVTTAGASQALTLAMHVLVKPGETVICDDPAYSN